MKINLVWEFDEKADLTALRVLDETGEAAIARIENSIGTGRNDEIRIFDCKIVTPALLSRLYDHFRNSTTWSDTVWEITP